MPAIYLFEAKGIQRFIFDSGRLRDAVGASELVDVLCRAGGGDLLEHALTSLGLEKQVRFARRAGGTFVAEFDTRAEAERLRALWTLLVAQHAPALEFTDALADSPTSVAAHEAVRREPEVRRNSPAEQLPLAGPLTMLAPRTGSIAIGFEHDEAVDAATIRKRAFKDAGELAARFSSAEGPKQTWPIDFDLSDWIGQERGTLFPFRGRDRFIGLVHADGNGVGLRVRALHEWLRKIPERNYAQTFLDFSQAVEKATIAAARKATEQVLDPVREGEQLGAVMPARPIVLGGDDLTAIVRGDLALLFTSVFIRAFEEESRVRMERLFPANAPPSIRAGFTACAGIAFVSANRPFHLAYELAESLSAHAKRRARGLANGSRPVPSAIAFHRATASQVERFADLISNELTVRIDGEERQLTLQPYGLNGAEGLASLGDLESLVGLLRAMPSGRGGLRQLLTLLFVSPSQARAGYQRWRDVLAERDKASGREVSHLALFDKAMEKMTGGHDADLPLAKQGTPLFDALDLIALEARLS